MEWDLRLIILVSFVGAFTVATAITDMRSRRIPNRLTVPMFFLGLMYQIIFAGWAGLGDAALAFLLGFGTLLLLWLVGGGGGGDVKLVGALSVWLGFEITLLVLIVSVGFVLAGTCSVLLWTTLRHGTKRTKKKYLATGKERGKRRKRETLVERQKRRVMAFALPVALATWAVLLWKLPIL